MSATPRWQVNLSTAITAAEHKRLSEESGRPLTDRGIGGTTGQRRDASAVNSAIVAETQNHDGWEDRISQVTALRKRRAAAEAAAAAGVERQRQRDREHRRLRVVENDEDAA